MERVRITGSDQKGNSLTASIDIALKNPSNISVLVDELPVEIFYDGIKVTIQAEF